MQNITNKLQISDLSFCQVVTEQDFEVAGGLGTPEYLLLRNLFSQPIDLRLPALEGYGKQEVHSDKEVVINELKNATTGISGYEVISKDGKSRAVVLFGNKSATAFSTNSNSSGITLK
ncbi:hypothetical protein [Calothrix sp. PCC 7507]|uniref:hypothetical protein n=1 Tax=Calothrix sp. PCC 7507 TaxID=99598 RepID=UPI00029EF477|nr:hypothetical protein [Calothrix sp. PCC 7507]AFY36155.1 hypothetical protein Cal7507_5841 [Calothrix sp. PCC 7507]